MVEEFRECEADHDRHLRRHRGAHRSFHFAFIAYMVTGGFIALRWPRTKAKMTPIDADGFIRYYLTGHLYPASAANLVMAVALLIVLASWVLFVARRRQTAKPTSAAKP